jgi:hypothetical protein
MAPAAQALRSICLRSHRPIPSPQILRVVCQHVPYRSFLSSRAGLADRESPRKTPRSGVAKGREHRTSNTSKRRPSKEAAEEDESQWLDPLDDEMLLSNPPMTMDTVGDRDPPFNPSSYWHDPEDEDEADRLNLEPDEDHDENDITSMAHGKLDEIRDMRQWTRVMAWEMPLLSSQFLFCLEAASSWSTGQLLTNSIRTGQTVRSSERRSSPALSLHDVYGRIPPSRDESRRYVLSVRLETHASSRGKVDKTGGSAL